MFLVLFSLSVWKLISPFLPTEFLQKPFSVKRPGVFAAEVLDSVYAFSVGPKKEKQAFRFHSYTVYPDNVVDWKTDIFVGDNYKPEYSFNGLFQESRAIDIDGDGIKEIEVELLSGKLTNSMIYKYQRDSLVRIPVSTERTPYFTGVVSSASPQYKDLDGDGVAEMLVFHRHYPPEKKRTVEVYRYTGVDFKKEKEYEESTLGIYY